MTFQPIYWIVISEKTYTSYFSLLELLYIIKFKFNVFYEIFYYVIMFTSEIDIINLVISRIQLFIRIKINLCFDYWQQFIHKNNVVIVYSLNLKEYLKHEKIRMSRCRPRLWRRLRAHLKSYNLVTLLELVFCLHLM